MTTILITNATLSLAALSTIVFMIAWAIRTSRPAITPISDDASPRQEGAGLPIPPERLHPAPGTVRFRPPLIAGHGARTSARRPPFASDGLAIEAAWTADGRRPTAKPRRELSGFPREVGLSGSRRARDGNDQQASPPDWRLAP